MRVFGRLESGFWDNPKVATLTDQQKLLLLYLYSCRHGNSIGCYVLRNEYIAADLGWSVEEATNCLSAIMERKFIARDDGANLIKVRGWWGHNALDNLNHAKHAAKSALSLPACSLKDETIAELRSLSDELSSTAAEALRDGLQMASGSHSDGITITETETETEKETEKETETETKRQTQTLAPSGAAREPAGEFDEWYNAYPRHVGRGAAVTAYKAARKKADHATLLAGATRAAKQHFNTEQRFIPHPATWLNEERWLDEEKKRYDPRSDPALRGVI
jgi:hypothetical protein